MRKVFMYMTTTFDGFVAGPNNELDWMLQTMDPEMTGDVVELMESADTGLIGYPAGIGMISYWSNVAKDSSASKGERELAQAINKVHGILISNREESQDLENAEVLVVKSDADLVEAITRLKQSPGKHMGVPGGVRTAQKFARLGLVDEYVFMVHPVAIGSGKRVFTTRVPLELIGSKAYRSGVVQVHYRPHS